MDTNNMEALLGGFPNFRVRQRVREDDGIDQLNHFVTVYLLAFAGVFIGFKEFMGEPLDCWVDMGTFQHFQRHVNSFCWAHKLYRYPNESDYGVVPYSLVDGQPGPSDDIVVNENELGEINFYRWVTIIFFIQAFLFKLPSLIWSEWNAYVGTQIETMVTMATQTSFMESQERASIFARLAEFLERWLRINRKPSRFMNTRIGASVRKIQQYCMLCVGSNRGNSLSTLYLIVKFLFLFNVLMQFVILSAFLDFNYWQYGGNAATIFSSGGPSANFPRVSLCHFQLKGEGHWIQCILTFNMLLENIFLVEWLWLILLLVINAFSCLRWILNTLDTQQSVTFVKKYLAIYKQDGSRPQAGDKTVAMFVTDYLGNDGVFLLRILAINTNDVALAELLGSVWTRYSLYGDDKTGVESAQHPDFYEKIQ